MHSDLVPERRSQLSSNARVVIDAATAAGLPLLVSAITIVEMTYLTERARISPTLLATLRTDLNHAQPTFKCLPFSEAIALSLSQIPRDIVPDMPDRMLAATALHLGITLITKDNRIRKVQISTIW